jgi:radical SAM superfamily enzyme YgiQ (UPF0313 family)
MKILFANPPRTIDNGDGTETVTIVAGSRWPHSFKRKKGTPIGYSPFPLYMAYAAAMVSADADCQVFVRDSIAMDEKETDFLRYVAEVQPDILFFEPATPTIEQDIEICRKLKSLHPKLVIFAGGIHSSGLHKETRELAGNAIDCYILGEYEAGILEAIAAYRRGSIPETATAAFDFRKAPWPARHLFPTNGAPDFKCYHDGFISKQPSATLHASRGCITHCDFCTEISLIEKKLNFRAATDICDEIEMLASKGIKEVYFDDSIFTGSKRHVMDFCEEMIKRGLPKKISWSAMCGFMGPTDEALLTKMAESGCVGVKFGIDSSSESVLKEIGKPLKVEKIAELCRVCNRLGIKCHGTLAIGHFADNEQTIRKTLEFAKTITCDTMQFSTVTPYPGTPLFEKLKQAGRLRTLNWREFNGLGSSVIIWQNGLSAEQLQSLIKKGESDWLHTMMKRPGWWLRQFRFFTRSLPSQGMPLVVRRAQQVYSAVTN